MIGSARGTSIGSAARSELRLHSVSIVVPVLDEIDRLGGCLEALAACGAEVGEILVVDGGSTDGTLEIIATYAAADERIRGLNAGPTPPGWNGKAWNLHCGLGASAVQSDWVVTIDADVRAQPGLIRALVAHAERQAVDVLSVAIKQELGDAGSGIVHPAMLTTLVYRYGLPGGATSRAARVQASGQCFAARRQLLLATKVFERARASLCEDVTAARMLARAGHRVGFYEAGDLVIVRMHDTWRQVWLNWPRSLTLRDGLSNAGTVLGLAEILCVQALPLVLVIGLLIAGPATSPARFWTFEINMVLLIVRIGVLAGTRRAYRNPPWTYWLSLLADVPVSAALIASALRKRHTWRGRALVMSERNT